MMDKCDCDDCAADTRCAICRTWLESDEQVRYQLVGEDSETFCRPCQEVVETETTDESEAA
jgi:hypothetical protein